MASTVAVVALVTLLAVATLAVTTRFEQRSSLAVRSAGLDVGAGYAAATTLVEWRRWSLTSMPVGSVRGISMDAPGNLSARAEVTRLGPELFWISGEAVALDGARRRESLVVRLAVPKLDSVGALTVAGDLRLTGELVIARSPSAGCGDMLADLVIAPGSSIVSTSGPVPSMRIVRDTAAANPAKLMRVGALDVAGLMSSPDRVIGPGAVVPPPSGIVHATGDLILTEGQASGVLLVDGRLTLAGPVSFTGLIIARDGIVAPDDGSAVTGAIRAGSGSVSSGPAASFGGSFVLRVDACAMQDAVASVLIPRAVAGRRWAELY
jgi:hypothetical protein